jgi:hypothetical protein
MAEWTSSVRAHPRAASPSGVWGGLAMYYYVFEFLDFEGGRITATRYSHPSPHPRANWVCSARDDRHALQLAKRAAMDQWPAPAGRSGLDFVVTFIPAQA